MRALIAVGMVGIGIHHHDDPSHMIQTPILSRTPMMTEHPRYESERQPGLKTSEPLTMTRLRYRRVAPAPDSSAPAAPHTPHC
jgi:hypothetical protein